jgi:predicted nucleotidyltransferase
LTIGVDVTARQLIHAAAETLEATAKDPVKIILFGSQARGDAAADSDFDFLVIERDPPDRHAEMVRLSRALKPLRIRADILVVSERYANDWAQVHGTILHAAVTEGRVLHAAA